MIRLFENKKIDSGFTLVELIVVLVILAILAAILLPALLSYIDRARDAQDMLKARNMLQATQARLSEAYAHDENYTLETGWNKDKDMTASSLAKDILKMADDNPYMCIVGVGDPAYVDKGLLPVHDMYTAYFVVYWESYEKDPIFFNGEEWMMDYPWIQDHGNVFKVNGKDKKMAFMFLTIPKGKTSKNSWNYLKETISKRGRDIQGTSY